MGNVKRRGAFMHGHGTAITRLYDMRSTIIVCGLPGCGKSTYVRDHIQPGERYWDYDEVMAHVSGKPLHTTDLASLDAVYTRRDHFVTQSDGSQRRVWFIAESDSSCLVRLMVSAGAHVVHLHVDERVRQMRLLGRILPELT